MWARFTVLSDTPIASAITGCVIPLSRSNTIWIRWRHLRRMRLVHAHTSDFVILVVKRRDLVGLLQQLHGIERFTIGQDGRSLTAIVTVEDRSHLNRHGVRTRWRWRRRFAPRTWTITSMRISTRFRRPTNRISDAEARAAGGHLSNPELKHVLGFRGPRGDRWLSQTAQCVRALYAVRFRARATRSRPAWSLRGCDGRRCRYRTAPLQLSAWPNGR
jgi:hypothetical protein